MTIRQLWVRICAALAEDSWLRCSVARVAAEVAEQEQSDQIDDVLAMVDRREV